MNQMDAIHRRCQALEDEYFQRVDKELMDKLRASEAHREEVEKLVKATGLHDDELFEHMLELGLNSTNVAAITLTPLVFVAWADGNVSPDERQTVISSALRQGVNGNPVAFKMLEQWLQNRPRRELWDLWVEYITDFHAALPPTTADKFAGRLLKQAEEVAQASGGVLGFGKVSDAERRLIDEIASLMPARSDS